MYRPNLNKNLNNNSINNINQNNLLNLEILENSNSYPMQISELINFIRAYYNSKKSNQIKLNKIK